MPNADIKTMAIMVDSVAAAKTVVTAARPQRLPCAAGYMSKGISGSQGPKTKITNNTHGVMFLLPSSTCA